MQNARAALNPRALHSSFARKRWRNEGVTILELLIAIVIFAVALLVLAFVLTSNFRGVRIDAERTVGNQVAVSEVEKVRDQIATDTIIPVTPYFVDGAEYTVEERDITPVTIAEDGYVAGGPASNGFEVFVRVVTPAGATLDFSTLVAEPEPEPEELEPE